MTGTAFKQPNLQKKRTQKPKILKISKLGRLISKISRFLEGDLQGTEDNPCSEAVIKKEVQLVPGTT